MLVFVDAGGGGWLPPVGGAGAGCGPRFWRWEESKGKSGGWEGAAPPLCFAALPRWLPRG